MAKHKLHQIESPAELSNGLNTACGESLTDLILKKEGYAYDMRYFLQEPSLRRFDYEPCSACLLLTTPTEDG